jgi:replicative DNA helicase
VLGNLPFLARRLVDVAHRRRLAAAARGLLDAAYQHGDPDEALQAAKAALDVIPAERAPDTRDVLYDHFAAQADDTAWIRTPWSPLNRILGGGEETGLEPGSVVLVGGWTSHGKSVLVDQILEHAVAQTQGCRAVVYINEMTHRSRGLRTVARLTGINYSKLRARKNLTPEEVKKAVEALGGMPFEIVEAHGRSADWIARDIEARRVQIAAVDHMHLIPHPEGAALDRISATLANAARRSGTLLITAVQFNEERAKTGDLPVPTLRDIRGSGMIKNDADTVLFVWRRQERVGEAGFERLRPTDEALLSVAKCRDGELGDVGVTFQPQRMRFVLPPRHLEAVA